MKDVLNNLAILLLLAIILLISVTMTGCASKPIIQKEIVTKKVYIRSKCPRLKVYDINKSLTLTAYNKDGKVCIKEWNTCIPQDKMVELISYIKYLKEINNKYKREILLYNSQFTK